ncbi:hypothetical protein [Sporomusa aerivorans]|uniref:hypothetical protein n=1 Tax=Sporomusa aerivorans TaxID=204936 RepID=UPI00352A9716
MKQKAETRNELDILLPESDVTINGEKIIIKPFMFAELPSIVKLLSKMGVGFYELISADGLQFSDSGNLILNQKFIENIGTIFENHFPEVAELMAIYTGKEPAFYLNKENGVDGEDGLMLLLMIIERNYGFFMKRLAPILEEIKAKQKSTGAKSS